MKKLVLKIKYSALWIPVPLTAVIYFVLDEMGYILGIKEISVIFTCTHLISAYVWSMNQIAVQNGVPISELPILPSSPQINPIYYPSSRMMHLRKEVDESLLSRIPNGITFGKSGKKYICVEPCKDGATHTLITAQTGAGKTVTVLATLLAHTGRWLKNVSFIMVDVKGELMEKGFNENNNIRVFNPENRNTYGFDFFYDVDENASEEKVLDALRRIIISLIPRKASSDAFWVDAPRQVLLGIFLYGWEQKKLRNLPDLADFAASENIKTLINTIIADTDETDAVYKLLVSFGGKDVADETLSSISMNIANALDLLKTDESLRYNLRENPNKISPKDVENGFSIDLQVMDYHLEKYACILNLCLATCSDYLSRRGEKPEQKVILILDEFARIAGASGEISGVQSLLQIGRSRGVSVILILQSWSALDGIYTKGAMTDMLTNLPYRLILQAQPDDNSTTEMCIKAFGKYREKTRSSSKGKAPSVSYSSEEKDILLPTDLLTLPEKKKAILICPHGAYMISKIFYYKDQLLKKTYFDIHQKNVQE